uniref:Uncharacterized protein n=1 Tax=viral metagenome TaxID=1070528 RepID=A0A6C0HBA6_9ZZZZ
MSNKSAPIVLPVNQWNTSSIRYMQPKINDRGAKSINIISTQTNRALHISTPLMMTWGISDFTDEKTGESDGKFTISLNFPNEQYKTEATTDFLKKLKDFENQILDDAVRNSEVWFGEELSRDVVKHNFFPFIKYSKDKNTKKIDLTKPPSIRAKVPNYDGRWAIEIYDTNQKLIFPCDNDRMTPQDFITKMSKVACVLQCGGLWFGGKGWGVTWKLNQCVVKPQEIISVYGKCHIALSSDEITNMDKPVAETEVEDDEEAVPASTPSQTLVADSDEEEEAEPAPAPVVKKVVKKVEAPVEVAAEPAAEPAKKKVVKKKVV